MVIVSISAHMQDKMMKRFILSLSDETATTLVERAVMEFRSARPVVIDSAWGSALVVAVEHLDEDMGCRLEAVAGGRAHLVLPAARLRRLGLDCKISGRVALPLVDRNRIKGLALKIASRIDAPIQPADNLDEEALELTRLSLVLPAVIVVPLANGIEIDPSVMRVPGAALRDYRHSKATDLKLVSRAPVPLEDAPTSEFVVFRGGEGLRDQVAIIVGKPDLSKPVNVRLHSACLTGDLFGSLKCDCGDQLRDTVRFMASSEGGILLYLDQEGRGNGIANKIRAYKLQSQGYDTYDADEVLGFEADQRRFDFAAVMLKALGVGKVRLMTNNPEKVRALREAGLDVISDERVFGRRTAENVLYLASKRDRAGHLINLDGPAGALGEGLRHDCGMSAAAGRKAVSVAFCAPPCRSNAVLCSIARLYEARLLAGWLLTLVKKFRLRQTGPRAKCEMGK
jgi:GTP cyclohydrolase II